MESPVAGDQLKDGDISKFKKLTDYILDQFPIEPTWAVTISVDTDEILPLDTMARTSWKKHYRDTTILVNPLMVIARRIWVATLIHEIYHLLSADFTDPLSDSISRYDGDRFIDMCETHTSKITNVIGPLFMEAHEEKMKKWL